MLASSYRFLIGTLFLLTLCGAAPAGDPMPVELWRGGDDGLTLRLFDALINAFDASPDFALSDSYKGILIVTIPTHVKWEKWLWRTRIIYTVEFSTKDKKSLGEVRGECWKGSEKTCADQVLKAANNAATKIPR